MKLAYFDALQLKGNITQGDMKHLLGKCNIVLFREPFTYDDIYAHSERIIASGEPDKVWDEMFDNVPFDYTWYEVINNDLLQVRFEMEDGIYHSAELKIHGIFFSEDKKLYINGELNLYLDESLKRGTNVVFTDNFSHSDSGESILKEVYRGRLDVGTASISRLATALRNLCTVTASLSNNRIQNSRAFQEHTRIRQKVKIDGKKEFITVRQLVYIGGKSDDHYITPGGKTLEYSHRFEIRGHWRKLADNSVGKNRDGVYCVPGKTWVRPFEKGPKDAPLVKKVRVVKESSENVVEIPQAAATPQSE